MLIASSFLESTHCFIKQTRATYSKARRMEKNENAIAFYMKMFKQEYTLSIWERRTKELIMAKTIIL